MANNESNELLDLIRVLGFNMFDTVLFLDTHPHNQKALDNYNKYKKLMDQAVKEYTAYYGPLTTDNANVDNQWTWGETPWPWEREAN